MKNILLVIVLCVIGDDGSVCVCVMGDGGSVCVSVCVRWVMVGVCV